MRFTKDSKSGEQDVIIYGASAYGELALRGLEKLGMKPKCFTDRARFETQYLGFPVIHPKELKLYTNACIFIASADFFYEIYNYLESIDCENIFDISYLLEQDIDMNMLSNRAKEMYNARENYFKAVQSTNLTIIHLGFCVSERCSLKCRDCSFLMQYYKHPQNIDLDYYKPAMDRFLNIIDFISELRIYGGEPFMNPQTYKLIEWYKENPKINTISIYTNGTIIPDRYTLECMKSERVKLHISDYEHNMDRVAQLIDVLEKEKITYFIRKYDVWQQAGDLSYRNHSREQLEDIYAKCFATNCYSFLKGKFYACPRAAHAVNLCAMKDETHDRVDFMETNVTDKQLKEQMIDLMHKRKYIEACRYCDGLNNKIDGVKPALQISAPLDYVKRGDHEKD